MSGGPSGKVWREPYTIQAVMTRSRETPRAASRAGAGRRPVSQAHHRAVLRPHAAGPGNARHPEEALYRRCSSPSRILVMVAELRSSPWSSPPRCSWRCSWSSSPQRYFHADANISALRHAHRHRHHGGPGHHPLGERGATCVSRGGQGPAAPSRRSYRGGPAIDRGFPPPSSASSRYSP